MTTLRKLSIQQFRYLSPLDWGCEYEGWITHRFFYQYDENENEFYPFGFLEDVEAKFSDENVLTEKDINEDLKNWFGFTDDEIKQLWDEDAIRIQDDAVHIVYPTRGYRLGEKDYPITKQERIVKGFSNPQIDWIYSHDDCESLNADKRNYSIEMLADVWKTALWETYEYDPDEHNDDDELPWTDEDVAWYKKVSLVGHYNHYYGTHFDPDDVKEDEWDLDDCYWGSGSFLLPLLKED